MNPISRKLFFNTRPSLIQFIVADGAAPTSGSITLTGKGLQAGDLMICFTSRDGSATPPTLPAGWTNIATNSTTFGGRMAYRFFVEGDTSVSFTNATSTLFVAYRHVDPTSPIGASGVEYRATQDSIYSPLSVASDGTSWLAGATFIISNPTVDLTSRPSGWSSRSTVTDVTDAGACIDSNGVPYYGSFPGYSYNNASSNDTLTFTVEIKSLV